MSASRCWAVAAAAVLVGAVASGWAAPVVLDAGFESPNQGPNTFEQANGTGGGTLAGSNWTWSPSAGITQNFSGFQNAGVPAPEGVQHALIQRTGSITQTLSGFTPGEVYSITLAQNRRTSTQDNNLQVLVDGQMILGGRATYTNPFTDVATAYFTPATATPTLVFQATNPQGGDRTTFVDHVRVTSHGTLASPTLSNPGFEDGALNQPWPSYGVVSGWASASHDTGNNDAAGPFVNGLPIPEGSRVGFIQRTGALSQNIVGLAPGLQYQIIYHQNERGMGGAVAGPSVDVDGSTIVDEVELTRQSEFRRVVSRPFTATGTTARLDMNNTGVAGDNTLLLDNVQVRRLSPLSLLFQDNFDVDNTDYGNPAGTHASEYNVNYGLGARQAGLYATRAYSELPHSATGGSRDNFTQVDNPQPGGVLQDGLLIAVDNGSGGGARFTAVSPNQNFNENVFNRLMIDFDVNPYVQGPDGDNWAAIRFLDDSQNVFPNAGGAGFGILFRDRGGVQAFDGSTSIFAGGDGTLWPAGATGWHNILIDVHFTTLDGVSPVTILAYADGAQFLNYVTTAGFTDNFVTLSGYYGGGGGGSLTHGFDNLNVYAQVPEPGTLALLGLGAAALVRRRRRRTAAA